jgi:hypothetical protein
MSLVAVVTSGQSMTGMTTFGTTMNNSLTEFKAYWDNLAEVSMSSKTQNVDFGAYCVLEMNSFTCIKRFVNYVKRFVAFGMLQQKLAFHADKGAPSLGSNRSRSKPRLVTTSLNTRNEIDLF